MNLREGTRRLALLLGVVGTILGTFASYVELQTVLNQRARHNRFEQLANSSVAEQARKNCFESSAPSEHQPWEKYQSPLPKGFIPDNPPYCFSPINDPNTFDYTPSELNSGGIKTVHFENREIASTNPRTARRSIRRQHRPHGCTSDCALSRPWIPHPVGCNSRNRMGGSRFRPTGEVGQSTVRGRLHT